jgi:DNA-binding response OmpR family regulator
MVLVLDFEGCDVRVAYDGAQALVIASAFSPELILLDIGLPDISGHEVCRELRASADRRTAVIVALTG